VFFGYKMGAGFVVSVFTVIDLDRLLWTVSGNSGRRFGGRFSIELILLVLSSVFAAFALALCSPLPMIFMIYG
jgi:hypothetical protein